MFESIQSIICTGFETVGAPCNAAILQINVWHLFVGLMVFALVSVSVWLFRRPNRLDKHNQVLEAKAPYGASPEVKMLRLHPHDFAAALGERGYDQITSTRKVASALNEKYSERYFVVQVRESGRKLFSKELKIVAWAYRLERGEFQLDPDTLAQLKAGSASKLDDDLDDKFGADGTFDIFFRKVRWWDLRHWLNHPAREIRYALYVAIFAASLEYSGDIFELFGVLFRTPNA